MASAPVAAAAAATTAPEASAAAAAIKRNQHAISPQSPLPEASAAAAAVGELAAPPLAASAAEAEAAESSVPEGLLGLLGLSPAARLEEYARAKERLDKLLGMQAQDAAQRAAGAEGMGAPEQQRLEEKVQLTMARLGSLAAGVPHDYREADCLWAELARGDVQLLSARWLVAHASAAAQADIVAATAAEADATEAATPEVATAMRLPRRQDCPSAAFVSLGTLMAWHSDAADDDQRGPTPFGEGEAKRVPVVAVSMPRPWPRGAATASGEEAAAASESRALQTLATALAAQLPRYEAHGYPDMGVYVARCSTCQPPFGSAVEEEAHKHSLEQAELWFAHSLCTVYILPDDLPDDNQAEVAATQALGAEGSVPIRALEDGWRALECQLAWLARLPEADNVWPQVVDLREPAPSPQPSAPAPLGCFAHEGSIGAHVWFADGPSRALAVRRYDEALALLLGGVRALEYEDVGWGDAEVGALGQVLPLCKRLSTLVLSGNQMTKLPDALCDVATLELLHLGDCDALEALPERLPELRALRELLLHDCPSLATLPDGLARLENLEHLHLGSCIALEAVPQCVAALQSRGCRVFLPRRLQDAAQQALRAAATAALASQEEMEQEGEDEDEGEEEQEAAEEEENRSP